jgi:GntR family transcriptional regulator, transcriptional repressor for pyruvate dehydrogenase complex
VNSESGTAAIEPVRRLKVADSVASQMTQLIAGGELRLEARLPSERALADQFGVGRSSMREALRILESNGLVRTEHGVGVFVSGGDEHARSLLELESCTLPDLFELRRSLEPLAAGLAARNRSRTAVDQIADLHTEADLPDTTDARFVQLDARLHRTIAEASGNPVLARMYASMEPLLVTYSERVIKLPDRRRVAHAGHQRIVDAVRNGRVRDAREAALRHIREVEQDVAAELQRVPPAG